MANTLCILAIGGTNGSGKDTLGALLAEHYGYWFFSFTELFREECRRRGIPVMRQNTRMVSAEWRRESGLATLVDRSMAEFEKAGGFKKYKGIVMSSLRNPYEPDRIHELGGTVIWVDADPKIRYNRVQAGAAARGRAGEDNKTYKQFLQEEQDETHPPEGSDEAALNMAVVKEKSDIFLFNNGNDLEIFRRDIVTTLDL